MPLAIGGGLATLAGLALLYLKWRGGLGRGGGWRFAVAGGWGLILLGLGLWAASGKGEFGLTLGALVLMLAALGLIGGRTAADLRPAARPRRAPREPAAPPPRPGGASRAAARGLGCLLLAPAVSLLAALLTRAHVPGQPADILIAAAMVTPLAWTLVFVVVLAAARPWRTVSLFGALTAAAAGLVFLPRLAGA